MDKYQKWQKAWSQTSCVCTNLVVLEGTFVVAAIIEDLERKDFNISNI
jgi:hypothetical protein